MSDAISPDNDTLHTGLAVTGLTHDGRGVVRIDGRAVFVPGVWPGEICSVRITEVKRRWAAGELVALETPSPDRQESPCPHPECGACAFLTLRYPAQLQAKSGVVQEALARIGSLKEVPVGECIGMEEPTAYRNKARFHAGVKDGQALLGFYRPGTHEPVAVPDCLLLKPGVRKVYRLLQGLVTRGSLIPLAAEGGYLRDVVVRESGSLMVGFTVAIAAKVSPEVIEGLRGVGVSLIRETVVRRRGREMEYGRPHDLFREAELSEQYGGLSFSFSPEAFAQVNPEQAKAAFTLALDAAEPLAGKRVLDLYCGAGFLGLLATERGAASVAGIEISRAAVRDAEQNASRNGCAKTRFHAGPTGRLLPGVLKEARPEVVFVDPPRGGVEPEAIGGLLAARPERIVYLSCDPGTFARDAARLVDGGYTLETVQPLDMFPCTHHVELVASFLR